METTELMELTELTTRETETECRNLDDRSERVKKEQKIFAGPVVFILLIDTHITKFRNHRQSRQTVKTQYKLGGFNI